MKNFEFLSIRLYFYLLKTRFIQFDLSNEVTILHKISHNVIDYGNAITNYISLLFDFDNLEVNIQPLTQGRIIFFQKLLIIELVFFYMNLHLLQKNVMSVFLKT